MEQQLRLANEQKKEATVIRRVSTQLEEIAYQQKDISDKQRQKAIYQTEVANQMREHAEKEREKALIAQEEAMNAYNQMEVQKRIAEVRQQEAIEARHKVDTLARLALGRSLGSQAVTQHTIGNKELASLLAYSAWKFTVENRGDVYQPAIFDALSMTSNMTKYFIHHKGAIRDMELVMKDKHHPYMVSVSQSGEILYWPSRDGEAGEFHPEYLFNDREYDFRKVYVDAERSLLYALSFNGSLVVIDKKKNVRIIRMEEPGLIGMAVTPSSLYVASRSGRVWKADREKMKFQPFYIHSEDISVFRQVDGRLLVGDVSGNITEISEVSGEERFLYKGDVQAPVTALWFSSSKNLLAVGYKNGIIHLYNLETQKTDELTGHISAITQIELVGGRVISSSYDCSVRLWNLDGEKIVSAIVSRLGEWIHVFRVTRNMQQLLIGSEKGTIYVVPISPDQMADRVRRRLTRDFTKDEWAYYIGALSEYESYYSSVNENE